MKKKKLKVETFLLYHTVLLQYCILIMPFMFSLSTLMVPYFIHYSYSSRVYPLVIAAHPSEPNQFALGLTNGGVHVLEPLETEGKWGMAPPQENSAGPSTSPIASAPDQSSK